jgi:hypothetical protein
MKVQNSSAISEVDYIQHLMVLEVTFKNGSKYAYHGVIEEEWSALLVAPSIGSFVAKQIKPYHEFEYLQLEHLVEV